MNHFDNIKDLKELKKFVKDNANYFNVDATSVDSITQDSFKQAVKGKTVDELKSLINDKIISSIDSIDKLIKIFPPSEMNIE